ncbi:MAG: lipopolysaccharide biosynthesis protein [Rhodospirillales bacterium]
MFRNAGLLLGGQGLAGLCGLAALALAARALGAEQFGALVLIHAYALVVATMVRFNGWYALIRYGAACLREERRCDLQGLIRFGVVLDGGGAVVGALAAVAAAPIVGPWLGWPPDAVAAGQAYGLVVVFNATDTPTGILRLFDRFDVLAWLRPCAPVGRCAGAVAAYAVGADLDTFLIVWFVTEVADSVLLWGVAIRELARRGHLAGMKLGLRGLARPHPGIWRLLWSTNLNSTLGMVLGRLTTLVVGSVLGPVEAGLYAVATQFAAVVERPVDMLRRTIYPELARLAAAADVAGMCSLGVRSGLVVGTCALPLLFVVIAFAEPALRLSVGESYIEAATVLAWLIGRQAVLAFGFPLSLILVSLDRAGALLKANVATSVLYVGLLMPALTRWGVDGAGFAAATAAVIATGLHAAMVVRTFRHKAMPAGARGRRLEATPTAPPPDAPARGP